MRIPDRVLVSDFSYVLLHPKDSTYSGSLNALHQKLSQQPDYSVLDHFQWNESLLAYYRLIREQLPLYLFTEGQMHVLPELAPILSSIFTHTYSASEFDGHKNEPETFMAFAEKLDIPPKNIIFVDDKLENVTGAKDAGCDAIQFLSVAQVAAEFATLGIGVPDTARLVLPTNSQLPQTDQHFLLEISWTDTYLEFVPQRYRTWFEHVLPKLGARTTNVHTAECFSFLPEIIAEIEKELGVTLDQDVVALSLTLHDSGWSELSEAEVAQSLGVDGLALTDTAMKPKEKHAVLGEQIARQVLTDWRNVDPNIPLSDEQIELICACVRWHDKPEAVAQDGTMAPEVRALVDLDHLWSFTKKNFWQDTARKGVLAPKYLKNLERDLDSYFVTQTGKRIAREQLALRRQEVVELFGVQL